MTHMNPMNSLQRGAARLGLALFVALTYSSIGWTQARNKAGIDPTTTVLQIGGEDVSLSDFQAIYGKNNRDSVYSVEALDDYMELFINFKLKVLEAEALGMDTVASFQKELAGNLGAKRESFHPFLC